MTRAQQVQMLRQALMVTKSALEGVMYFEPKFLRKEGLQECIDEAAKALKVTDPFGTSQTSQAKDGE